MTFFPRAPQQPQYVNEFTRSASEGCTFAGADDLKCGTQDTEFLSGHTGRRCAQHAPVDPYAEETEHDCA